MWAAPLIRTCFRDSRAQPLRTALMILGIALGVAGVVSIDIARTSVSKSFELSTQALTGKATHQITGSDFSVPQTFFTRLRTELGVAKSAPVISKTLRLQSGRALTFMGVDPFSETLFRPLPGAISPERSARVREVFIRGDRVIMDEKAAHLLGLGPGDTLDLYVGERVKSVTVGALIPLEGVILADIALAQEFLEMGARISHIDLILTSSREADRVRAALPTGLTLTETAARNGTLRGLSASFETSLAAFSMLVLFMGVFLIYNTVSFAVARRRHLNGIFRALGAGRRDIFFAVQIEVLVYALAGSALGLGLGVLLGRGAVQAVCATVSDMYYTLTVSQTHISGLTLAKGFAVGLAAALFSSVVPALSAANTKPLTLMQSGAGGDRRKAVVFFLALAGGVLLSCALWIFSAGGAGTGVMFLGVFMVFSGASLICPLLIVQTGGFMTKIAARVEGMGPFNLSLGIMGIRLLVRSLGGSAVLIASLTVVISVYIGIDTMTRSFRLSIGEWVDGHIGGDIHISSPDALHPSLPPDLPDRISGLDGVAAVSAYNIHRSFSSRSGEVHIFSYIRDLSLKQWTFLVPIAGPAGEDIPDLLDRGWIVVSEIFAQRHGISGFSSGGVPTVVMDTVRGKRSFRVAGIFRDFFMGGGRVIVGRAAMKSFWSKTDITSIQVFTTAQSPGEKAASVARLTALIQGMTRAGDGSLRIRSGADIKARILAVFDKTFLITTALQFLTALVALTGVVNAIMAQILSRSRQLAVLRACGAEGFQIRRLILWESGTSGFMAGLFALPLGIFLSHVLVSVVNYRAFGWTYEVQLSGMTLVQALVFSFLAALCSGLIPAVRAGRLPVSRALRAQGE